MKQSFLIGNLRFEPEAVIYNNRRSQIWTVWKFVDRMWQHNAKLVTKANETKANVFIKYNEIMGVTQ